MAENENFDFITAHLRQNTHYSMLQMDKLQ